MLLALIVLQFSMINFGYAANSDAQVYYEKGKDLLYSVAEGTGPEVLEAITAFEAAIRLDPDLVDAYLLLSDAYGKTLISLEYQSAEWKEVKKKSDDLIRKAVEIAPENTKALIYYSSLVRDRAEYLSIYQKIVELEPDHPEAHASYAHILNLMGKKDEAIKEYLIHIKLNDKKNDGFIHREYIGTLWDLLTERNRKAEAIELMQRFLEGSYPPAAIANTLKNEIDTSAYTESEYQDVVRRVNQFKNYGDDRYYRQAREALDAGQLDEAMKFFAQHIDINPFNARYYHEFAQSLISSGHYKEAYSVYESLLDSGLKKPHKCNQLDDLRLRVDFVGPKRSLPNKLIKECGHEVILIQ
jgi:tetratricopeptide (TPR) repeat protein